MRGAACVAALALGSFTATTLSNDTRPASAAPLGSVTRVPLNQVLRSCDFSRLGNVSPTHSGSTVDSVVRSGGSNTVAVDVHLAKPSAPGTHYDVGLIQMPRPSSSTCGPGDAGTVFGGLDTDPAGRGATTLQAAVQPGATGVWVVVQRPDSHSQAPAEYYSSDFVAPI
jgi:hypothetical protein